MDLVITYTVGFNNYKVDEDDMGDMLPEFSYMTLDEILDEITHRTIPDDIDVDWESNRNDKVECHVYSNDFEYINMFFTTYYKNKKFNVCGTYTITFHELMRV